MRVSGHKIKRARADLSHVTVARTCRQLGFPMTPAILQRMEAQESTELEEWHATILAAALGAGLSSLVISAPAKIDQLTEDVWWIKAQLYRLAESFRGADMALPIDAGPELEHYYLHTPIRPRAGCKACVENFGGPEI